MDGHLIIALGGTGGRIVRAFRKTIFQEHRCENPGRLNVEFLYVDSSNEMMDPEDPSWRILGKNIQLNTNQQLLIRGVDLAEQFENIRFYPGVKDWIGNREQWEDIIIGNNALAVGGQKRRLGRLLFANRVGYFEDQINLLVRNLQNRGADHITYHICCGLAGGTGSGSIVDVICQLRKRDPDSQENPIRVYALLPERNPKKGWAKANYHSNGFAALMELNSLSVGEWKPHDVVGTKHRLNLQNAFNGCYLFCDENENGIPVDVEKDIPNIVADFLYHKLIAGNDVIWKAMLDRIENCENLGGGLPERLSGSKDSKAVRSRKFLSFGIKRIIVPEEEIREYLTYSFALQSILQMLYNNWSLTGFSRESALKKSIFATLVRQDETREAWRISDEHMCLSKGILQDEIEDKKWKQIKIYWRDVITNIKDTIRKEVNRKMWLDKLAMDCADRFDLGYRGMGVSAFYKIKSEHSKEHAKAIRDKIEFILFDEWKNGKRSVYDIGVLLDGLLDDLRQRQDHDLKEKITNEEKIIDDNRKTIEANEREWVNYGIGSILLGKADRLLDAQAICYKRYYTSRTHLNGWHFANKLFNEIIHEITSFREVVTDCISLMTKVDKQVYDNIKERCVDDKNLDLNKLIIKEYDPADVKKVAIELTRDLNVQSQQCQTIRDAIVKKMGVELNFTTFRNSVPMKELVDILESMCAEEAEKAHDNLIASNKDIASQLRVNIIERLYRKYSGNTNELNRYIRNITKHAANYLPFNTVEIGKVAPGIPGESLDSMFTVILPSAPELVDFVESLKKIFEGCLGQGRVVEFVESNTRLNEITLISIKNVFPLRFVRQVHFLGEKYKDLFSSSSEQAMFELHCESDVEHPGLFVASGAELKRTGLPWLLLAKVLGLLEFFENPVTGVGEWLLNRKSEYGISLKPLKFGPNFVKTGDMLNDETIEILRLESQKILDIEYNHIEKRKEIIMQIGRELDDILKACNGNFEDPDYLIFQEAAQDTQKTLIKEG